MTSLPSGDFRIAVPSFEGTVDDLLVLVAQNRILSEDLPIATIVGELTQHLATHDGGSESPVGLEEAGRLIMAVATLMLRKSAQLLVQPVYEAVEDTEARPSRRTLDRAVLGEAVGSLSGREGLESFAPVAMPHRVDRRLEPRSPVALARAWNDLQIRAARARARVAVPSFVRLETAVSGLIRRLRSQARLSFSGLLRGADRNEAVVHFLAVLELVRRRQASAAQSDLFEDIVVDYVESGADEASRAG